MHARAALSIGIVGAGTISRKSHLPVLLSTAGAEISWIHDRRAETASMLAGAYGIRAVHPSGAEQLPPCDVALLAIPVEARSVYLQTFSERGTAVLCEKPFAMSAADHMRILSAFAPHALGAGFMRRTFRSTGVLHRIVSEGIFGPLLRIEIREGGRSRGSGADNSFLDDFGFGPARGVLADLGSHSIDLALFVSSAVDFQIQSCTRVMDGAVDRKVTATVLLTAAARPIELSYCVSWLDRQVNTIRLMFENATVWSGLAPSAEVFVGDPRDPRRALCIASQQPGATTYNQAFFLEWQHFLGGVRAQQESIVSARSALLTTSLIEALLATESDRYD